MGRMKQILHPPYPVLAVLLSAVFFACSDDQSFFSKNSDVDYHYGYMNSSSGDDVASQAIGTVKTRNGVRYVQLDDVSAGFVVNPSEIRDIADGTRVYLQYRDVVYSATPDFCTDAILVEWATPLEEGYVSSIGSSAEEFSADRLLSTDPVDIVPDWVTSLEDGFLTLHYLISCGDKKHAFSLHASLTEPAGFYLVHDAGGDAGKTLKDGIICFRMNPDALFRDLEEGETATLTLHYLNLDHTQKTLTFEYRSPK